MRARRVPCQFGRGGPSAALSFVVKPSMCDERRRFVWVLALGGPLNEELGWRGFALPGLLQGLLRSGPVHGREGGEGREGFEI